MGRSAAMAQWLRTVLFLQRTRVRFLGSVLGRWLRASDSLMWTQWAPHVCTQTMKTHNEK